MRTIGDTAPPTQYITPDNHGAYLTIVAALLMTWMLVVLAMRILIRVRFNGPWGYDDTAVTIGSVFAVGQVVAEFFSIHAGLGQRQRMLSPAQLDTVAKTRYAAAILYICAVAASKCSTALLIARLSREKRHLVLTYGTTALAVVWAAVSILVLALKCDLSKPWDFTSTACHAVWPRWVGIEVCSIFIEVCLVGLSVQLVWGLRMALCLKAVVVCAFSCRILVIVIIVVRLGYLKHDLFHTEDYTFDIIYAAILLQVCMHYSLMAATIPCTKPFMRAFDSDQPRRCSSSACAEANRSVHATNSLQHEQRRQSALRAGSVADDEYGGKLGSRGEKKGSLYEVPSFRSDVGEVSTVIDCSPEGTVMEESMSIHGVERGEMVIHQKRDWEIRYDRVNA